MPSIITETTSATKFDLAAIQQALRENKIDGWLFYDHHHRDPIGERILGLDPKAHITRRWYYYIPATGEPASSSTASSRAASTRFPAQRPLLKLAGARTRDSSHARRRQQRIAMQYSPNNAIMYVSMVDAGTIEFLRGLGKQIVSSADLVSQFEAVLTDEQIATPLRRRRSASTHSRRGLARDRPPSALRQRRPGTSPNSPWCNGSQRSHERAKASSGRTAPTSASTPTAPTRTTSPPPSAPPHIRKGDFLLIESGAASTT